MNSKRQTSQRTNRKKQPTLDQQTAATARGGRAFGKDITNLVLNASLQSQARAADTRANIGRKKLAFGKRRLNQRILVSKGSALESRIDGSNKEKPQLASAYHQEILQYLASVEVTLR